MTQAISFHPSNFILASKYAPLSPTHDDTEPLHNSETEEFDAFKSAMLFSGNDAASIEFDQHKPYENSNPNRDLMESTVALIGSRAKVIQKLNTHLPRLVEELENPPPEQAADRDAFDKVLEWAKTRMAGSKLDLVENYTRYIVSLSELVTTINSLVKSEADGKHHLHGVEILKELEKHCDRWSGSRGVIGSFDTKEEADKVAGRFSGGTVRVVKSSDQEGGRFEVRVSFSKLIPIARAVNAPDTVIQALENNRPLFEVAANMKNVLGSKCNSYQWQNLQLAYQEVQKIHQTDVEVLNHEMDRVFKYMDTLRVAGTTHWTSMKDLLLAFL
ncbi:hypothetical protein [Ralstonia mojiangensis]|uniref:hypothetical protein n=1 Tax=Ralstonia mojiangensis TaxID=2953895 RepID=UPI0021B34F0B|nr:hypothetical protein [Ralstonia mojiangensis]MCT7328844.1 hypothetical protein [Ralstonia mojiangensis]